MWGQGLNRSDTFAELIKRGLGIENGKQAILDNRARSGAVLIGRDEQRKTFLYLYPTFFKGAAPLRRRFVNGDEGRARLLYGEVPASLPSVKYQVGRFIGRVGNRIDVALLTGGANDIGFTDVVNPQKFPGAFIEEYDGQIRRVAHDDLLDQIQHTRQACPRALIMVFGYYPPLSYASDDSAIKAYFEREFNDGFLWWVNEEFGIEDIDRMILEAKVRAVWALGRAQHWMRKAITKANRSDDRGPGILFVPSGMTQDNAAFAPATEMHEDYRPPTKDDARTKRENTIPRIQLLDRLRRMLRLLTANEFRGKELRALRGIREDLLQGLHVPGDDLPYSFAAHPVLSEQRVDPPPACPPLRRVIAGQTPRRLAHVAKREALTADCLAQLGRLPGPEEILQPATNIFSRALGLPGAHLVGLALALFLSPRGVLRELAVPR
jgi:hypothetical protein